MTTICLAEILRSANTDLGAIKGNTGGGFTIIHRDNTENGATNRQDVLKSGQPFSSR